MHSSLLLTKEQIGLLEDYYKSSLKFSSQPYTVWRLDLPQCSLTLFTTNRLLFQGKASEAAYQEISEVLQIKTPLTIAPKIKLNEEIMIKQKATIGSDEVGTGDYFGPIVVCSCFVSKDKLPYLSSLGIKDSKKLSDERILSLAPEIMNNTKYTIITLNNETYNTLTRKPQMNLNKLKAILHNRALLNMQKMNLPYEEIILDAFTNQNKYFTYLEDQKEICRDVLLIEKAEDKYLAVACASIIARSHFLNALKLLSSEYGFVIPKGAGKPVNEAIKIILSTNPDLLGKIAKLNFANTKIVILKK